MEKRKLFHLLARIHNIPLEEAEVILMEPGSRLGPNHRYEIIDLLGTGSIGAVYLAKDYQERESLLCLKIIVPYVLLNTIERRSQLFESHLHTLQYLDHPNVAKVQDYWKEDNLHFYTTEYVAGYSLKEWIHAHCEHKKKVTCAEACQIFLQICHGLSSLHRYSGHYRLHPENIRCSREIPPHVKICDFGIYCLQAHSFWHELAVTLDQEAYQAPEHSRKLVRLTVQSDIYSLGALLYETLTGQCPTGGEARISDYRKDITSEWNRIVSSALQQQLEHRQKNVEEFMEQLLEAMEKAERESPIEEDTQRRTAPAIKDKLRTRQLAGDEMATEVATKPDSQDAKIPGTARSDQKTRLKSEKFPKIEKRLSPPRFRAERPSLEKEIAPPAKPAALVEEVSKMYNKSVELCRRLSREKRWDEVVEHCQEALQLMPSSEVEAMLKIAHSSLKQAAEYKKLALQMKDDPSSALDLLRQSMEIYPEDPEAKRFYHQIEKDVIAGKDKGGEALAMGDSLVEEGKYLEALKLWKEALGVCHREKELSDRIMQVVDMLGETAREQMAQGDPYKAKETLEQLLDYTGDLLIIELFEEVENEIHKRAGRLEEACKEAEKHLEKRQFKEAVQLWKSVMGLSPLEDEHLQKRIKEAGEMAERLEKDEQEYLQMISYARKFEQREDYENALQTWQKIQHEQKKWVCPTSDVTKEIEKLTKLVAANNVALEAKKILLEAENAIRKGKYDSASALLANPIFRRKLFPVVENKFHGISEQLRANIEKRKKMQRILWIAVGISVAIAIAVINIL